MSQNLFVMRTRFGEIVVCFTYEMTYSRFSFVLHMRILPFLASMCSKVVPM